MLTKYSVLSVVLSTIFLWGCKNPPVETRDDAIAKVAEHTLYLEDIQLGIGDRITEGDSAKLVNDFIQQWIREKVLLAKAEATLSTAEQDKSDLVTQYYNDLLIYELEQKLLSDRLDTIVDPKAVLMYYENNKKNFELKENIVRLRFFVIPKKVMNHDKLWSRFKVGGEKNLQFLSRVSEVSKSNYFYQDSVWLSFNDILKEIPITTYNQESYLNNHRFVRLDEKDFSYFVEILDFKVKNNTSPLDFEKPRIKAIIIHKRKVELLQQIESEIVEEAYRNNKIEKF
ncbi:MAG: hypothetical protein ACI8SE_000474 [Bacteroidia bacterium]|jgi:hypothetical protein